MLLVKRPATADLIEVVSGLLDGTLSREEVASWHEALVRQYEDLADLRGYWYLQSFSALTVPMSLGDGEAWFVRERDLSEYLYDLREEPSAEAYQGVARIRSHEIDAEQVRWPLLMFEQEDPRHLERLGLTSVRGIFDTHLDLVEHTHLLFRSDLYLIVRQYDDQAHQLMVLGTNRDTGQLRQFLETLGLG